MTRKRKGDYGYCKCRWCAQFVPRTNKGGAKPHRNGAQQCPGSGQPHEEIK